MLSLFHILHLRGALKDGKDGIARYENIYFRRFRLENAESVNSQTDQRTFDAPFETLFA